MSQTLSTNAMITKLQRKFPIGLQPTDCMDFLNEAYRKINQMSKGGYIWQLKWAQVQLNSGIDFSTLTGGVTLPTDFDAGKSAWLSYDTGYGVTAPYLGVIPFRPFNEFIQEQHFQNVNVGNFSSWTIRPGLLTAPNTYFWILHLNPTGASPLSAPGTTLLLRYHTVTPAPLTAANNVYFPTPDQFDSLIVDIAEAEYRRIYGYSGWDKLAAAAMQAVSEIIDTYRTDRYDLAGLSDQMLQSQEKAAEGAK